MTELTADAFVAELTRRSSPEELARIERLYRAAPGTELMGVRMKTVFDTAKAFERMPLDEVDRLFETRRYEPRVGAVSILDFKARRPRLDDDGRRALYELYLRRHDRIDNWDLVDRAAPRVIGGYLVDRSRQPLFDLAASPDVWRRRTAITATFFFVRQGDLDDTYALAELLLDDPAEPIHKSVGTALREAGKVDVPRLVAFLGQHRQRMPRVTLRFAIERLDPGQRAALLAR